MSLKTDHLYHFRALPMGMRVLFTSTLIVLGAGYMFAMIYIFESHAGRDGNASLSVNDLIIAYSGSKADTRLESALKGPMSGMLPAEEKNEIIAWVRRGAKEDDFNTIVQPIVQKRCSMCHNGSNPHVPNLSDFNHVKELAARDTGMDIFTLVRVSHIHLFGITFIFFIMGTIFSHAYIKPMWVKCMLIALPFLSIVLDIGSWYLTKIYPPFAYVVMGSGFVMGLCFAAMWVISFYQMWFYKPSSELEAHDGAVS